MTVAERLDQLVEDVKVRNAAEVARARRIALQQAYAAVAACRVGRAAADRGVDAALDALSRLANDPS